MSHSGQASLVCQTDLPGELPRLLSKCGHWVDAGKHEILEDQGSKMSKRELSPHWSRI